MFEAVTRCKMHCQKNPWKIPHWGNNFFFLNHSLFLSLCFWHRQPLLFHSSFAHSRFSLSSTFLPICSYKFKDTETAVPVVWQIYKQRKRLDFSFIVTKTQKTQESSLKSTIFFLNRKAPYWNIFQSLGASDQVLNIFLIVDGIWLQIREVHSSMVVLFSSLML